LTCQGEAGNHERMELDFDKMGGLVPAIVQDASDGTVLMQAYMNREAWDLTLATGFVHYYSRSRDRLWKKGESSGHVQTVKEIYVDCDGDCVLVKAEQAGGTACHTGNRSCFFTRVR